MKITTLVLALLFASQMAQAGDVQLRKVTVKSGDVDVPAEIAIPAGKGPFPPVLYIHAKRGYDEVDQRHIATLAEQGFLVLAPDWQGGRFIERWPSAHDPATENDVEAAEVMRDRGYRTLHLGKWHLGEAPEMRPEAQGFDESMGFMAGAAMFLPPTIPKSSMRRCPSIPSTASCGPTCLTRCNGTGASASARKAT